MIAPLRDRLIAAYCNHGAIALVWHIRHASDATYWLGVAASRRRDGSPSTLELGFARDCARQARKELARYLESHP